MSEKGFIPLTSQLGISGTSYRLQLGLINDKWASRILKGSEVIDSFVYKDDDIAQDGMPNSNLIVGWCLRTIAIPNINPHQIMKTTQVLVKQAMDNREKQKVVAPVAETKQVELEKVPEVELKRPKAAGWVKEEGTKTAAELEEEKRKAFKERMASKKEGEKGESIPAAKPASAIETSTPTQTAAVSSIKTSRKLPSIPSGASSEAVKEPTTPKVETPAPKKEDPKSTAPMESKPTEATRFCPYCGKDLNWVFCPYCGKPLPHEHK